MLLSVLLTPDFNRQLLYIPMTNDKVRVIWPFWPQVDLLKGESHAPPLDFLTLWAGVPCDFEFLDGEWGVGAHLPLFN